jgi:hypothetical protein
MTDCGIIEKPHVWGLFKNVQMQGEQKTDPRSVYGYTLSGAFCSATQQTTCPSGYERFSTAPLRDYFSTTEPINEWQ